MAAVGICWGCLSFVGFAFCFSVLFVGCWWGVLLVILYLQALDWWMMYCCVVRICHMLLVI